MSFLTKLFGKSKGKRAEVQLSEAPDQKPASEPKRTGTTLRKPEGPKLTALEIADRRDWEVKSLPVWEPGDVILDTYEVEDVISGGMGHVYIANHNKWNVKLAIKSPNEVMLSQKDYFARILREANSWTEMGLHPNIAYCYYVRNIEDVPHIVVEYVDGGDLRQWIEDGKCIDHRVNLDLAIQFCHGMEFAHSKGMIHRDIKPANVLMTKDGILKITDFGLVRERGLGVGGQVSGVRSEMEGRKPVDHGLTTVGAFMGTEGYIAPEQAESARDVDERADIFSFGVCLYEMFCGNRPYEITYGPRQDAPDPVELSGDEKFPSEIGEVLTKSVQWDPSERYNSFKEIRHELARIYHEMFSEESPHAELELLDLESDGLNNRGISYFDLGRKEDAVSCWEQALEINQIHLEATYNLSLIQWRDGEITDDEVLRRLDNCSHNPTVDKETLAELTAYIHAERFDPDTAKDVLKDLPRRYEAIFSDTNIDQMRCIRTMEGHTDGVRSVAITPDGRFAVSGSSDKTLRLWDLETGQCIRTLEGHTDGVKSVTITPDGKYAVSGSGDKTLRIWDLETGQCLRIMEGHIMSVNSVTITPDGRYAVSGSLDNTIRIWDLETGRCAHTLEGHTKGVNSVTITPDGRFAVSGSGTIGWESSKDCTVRLWDLETGQCMRTMKGHTQSVESVYITPDGRYAVSGSNDDTIRMWDFETGQCMRTMEGHTGWVNSVTITPDGRYAVSGSQDKTLRMWDLETGRCTHTLEGHTWGISSVTITPDSRYAVSGSWDNTLRMWELQTGKSYLSKLMVSLPKRFEQRKKEEEILNGAISKAEELYKKGDHKQSFTILYKAWEDTGFSHKDVINRLYSGLMKKGRIKDISFSFQKKILRGHTDTVGSVAITPDGRYAVSGSQDKTLRMWDLETGQCVHTVEWNSSVTSVILSPDGRYAVSGFLETLRMDLKTGQCLRTQEIHKQRDEKVAITPDGRYSVSGWGADNFLRMWDLETGQCLCTMKGHTDMVESVAITPDGRYAVSGSQDKTLRMWDLETGRCLRTMEGHTHWVKSISLTPDGRYAASGSLDNTIRVWEFIWDLEFD